MRVLLRVLIVAAVAIALIAVETTSRSGVLWRLTTFTYQANVLAAGYYLWTLFGARADGRAGVRGAVVLYVVVAGVLWNLLLTEYSMGYTPANILLHIVVPVLAILDWLLVDRGQRHVALVATARLAHLSRGLRGAGVGRAQQGRAARSVLLSGSGLRRHARRRHQYRIARSLHPRTWIWTVCCRATPVRP